MTTGCDCEIRRVGDAVNLDSLERASERSDGRQDARDAFEYTQIGAFERELSLEGCLSGFLTSPRTESARRFDRARWNSVFECR